MLGLFPAGSSPSPLLSIDSHVLYFFCCFLFPLFLSFCLGGLERICGTSLSVTNLIKTNGSDSSSFISQRIPDFGSWTHHRNGSPVLSLHDRIMKRFMLHNFPQCQIIILFRSSVKAAVINCKLWSRRMFLCLTWEDLGIQEPNWSFKIEFGWINLRLNWKLSWTVARIS